MYIAPWQGQTTPWNQNLTSTESSYHFAHLLQVLNILYTFFHVFPHVYSPRQGQTTYWGQKFDDNRKAFSPYPYVPSFKMISSKSDFIHTFVFLMIYYMYIALGQGHTTLGDKLLISTERPYHFAHSLQV